MLDTPVAFFIFNRPQLTDIVFNSIREAKPKRLLIVADGPRFSEDEEKCFQARSVVKKVDWPCQLSTNFSDVNLGCKHRVSSGLNWVFSEVEEAIILEDDCLPSSSFFLYCQNLLEYYRNDKRVMLISGSHVDDGICREYSYYFSKYAEAWGWASWRRAWQYYDVKMATWPDFKSSGGMKCVCDNQDEQLFWTELFDRLYQEKIDTWDYQLMYACWRQSGLTVIPNINLITNLGFHKEATHTKSPEHPLFNMQRGDIGEIKHPRFVMPDREADQHMFRDIYCWKSPEPGLLKKIFKKSKQLINHGIFNHAVNSK